MTGTTRCCGMVTGRPRWTGPGDKKQPSTGCASFDRNPQSCPSFAQVCLPGLFDPRRELLDEVVDAPVFLDQLGDLGRGVDDGRVVAPAELLADFRERAVGELAAQVHRHLAWVDDRLRAAVADELLHRDPEAVDDGLLDP